MTVPYAHIQRLYIGGEWVAPSGGLEDVINPATEEVFGQAPVASRADVEAAIAAAREAFDRSSWPRLPQAQRSAYIQRLHDALLAREEEICALLTAEVGTAWGNMPVQFGTPLEHIRSALAQVKDETTQLPIVTNANPANPAGPRLIGSGTVVREPIGVVAGISGYNYPFLISLAKVVPALLTGNTLVLKPSPFTPFSTLMLGEVADEIGLPKGVLNIVSGGAEAGEVMSSDPRVDMVTFTGSETVGAAIMAQAAPTLKRVHFELGGKSAMIARADADLARVVGTGLGVITNNCGQGCALLTRHLVHNSLKAQYIEAFRAAAASVKIGDPSDRSVRMGPLIRATQRAKVEHYVQLGQDEGAKLVAGGKRPEHLHKGFFHEVTLLDGTNDMRVAREEIFGPVAVVIGFDSDEEAIAIANDSPYGLYGGIITNDPATGYEMALQLRTGGVILNGGVAKMPFAPFGGYKRSGIGREYGDSWLREFTQEKSIIFPIGR